MSKNCSLCSRQSPIDIITGKARYQEFRPFKLTNYENFSIRKNNLKATNNGATLKLVSDGEEDLPTLQGGPLNVAYEFVEVHFHWGEDESDNGSEHKIDGKSYPMEMHIVHKNIHDDTIEEALTHENGLAVLGFKFAVVEDDKRGNPGMDTLTKLARQHLVNPGSFAQADKLPFNQDVAIINFLPQLLDCYFYYSGSLTTGTCSEAVNWIVFKNPLAIHKDNLKDFQSLMDEENRPLINNYRPVQPANDRPLYYHGGEFLKSGIVSKGTGRTAKSHAYPNQRDYLLTVPASMLMEIAPLAKTHLSENAKKIIAEVGNRAVYEAKKYGMIWYKKVMDRRSQRFEMKETFSKLSLGEKQNNDMKKIIIDNPENKETRI